MMDRHRRQEANGADADQLYRKGIQYLNKRVQSSSLIVMVLAAGIVVPMTVEHSNKQQRGMHLPTVLTTYLTFVSGLSLRGLVGECPDHRPGRRRYIAIKSVVHVCALLLVSLSFSLSLMMRMNVVATSVALAASAAFVVHRLQQCAATELRRDVEAYSGCEEKLQQLLELSTDVTSMLFGGWFGMAFFYFQNYPEEARDARFLPSEYLTFLTSVGASLMLLKAVRKKADGPQDVDELVWLIRALVAGVVATALVIAASKVRGYAALALVPVAIALLAWGLAWLRGTSWWGRLLPLTLRDRLATYYRGEHGDEPAPQTFVTLALTLLLSVLTYRAKEIDRAMSTLYDEAFVLVTASAAVAALGWRLFTHPPMLADYPEAKVAANVLRFSTFWLLFLSVLAFLGVIFGW